MEWTLKKVKLKDLKPNKKNPRRLCKNDADQLKRSIKKFGVCEPLVVNLDNTIIGGHQRFKTLKALGHTEVEVYMPDEALSDEEADELCIRLNKNLGMFDFDILANNFEVEDLLDWGFLPDELDFFLIEDDEITLEKEEKDKCPTCGKQMKKNHK